MKQKEDSNGFGIASLVLGICGLLFLGIILGPLAIIFGAIGISSNQKYSKAGLVLGIIDTVISVIALVFLTGLLVSLFSAF